MRRIDEDPQDTGAVRIRAARADELVALQAIEDAAGMLFAGIGMGAVAEAEPASLARLEAARRAGCLLVAARARDCDDVADAADAADVPIGFALLGTVDGTPHLFELDVHPDHGRRGIGRRLVAHAVAWARGVGGAALTLTTYRDVAWNAPYYARLGFRELPEAEHGPELVAVRRREREAGLDAAGPRIAMRLALAPEGAGD